MTQEIFGAKWQDDVRAIAVANADLDLAKNATATLQVYAVFGGGVASRQMDNSYFTFAVDSGSAASVNANTGVVTASSTAGTAVISVTLKEHTNIVGYANVTVA